MVATKFLPRTQDEIMRGDGQQHIEQIDTSLRIWDWTIDLYIYHMWDYETPSTTLWRGWTGW